MTPSELSEKSVCKAHGLNGSIVTGGIECSQEKQELVLLLEKTLGALRRVEWGAHDRDGYPSCPYCHIPKDFEEGHKNNCVVAEALK